jgi:hypothetical protein
LQWSSRCILYLESSFLLLFRGNGVGEILSKRRILIWEIIGICVIIIAGGPLHSLFEASGYWRPVALIAAVNESIWEHMKMFFWPGLLFAGIQYLFTRGRIPNYWFGKLVGLIITPVVSVTAFVAYLAIERASGEFAPSDVISISVSTLSVFVGQAACYWALTSPSVPTKVVRFSPLGYLLLFVAFSSFTYFPPKLYLFEQQHHYMPIGEYGIDAAPQVGDHPWDLDAPE